MPRSRRRAAVLVRAAALTSALVLGASLSACSAAVSVDPAPDATDPACAPEMIAMPDTLGDAALRTTTSQATAAWGDPSAVILRCGVPAPGPTTDRCVTVNGVDWVIKDLTTVSASPTPSPSSSAASHTPSAPGSANTGAPTRNIDGPCGHCGSPKCKQFKPESTGDRSARSRSVELVVSNTANLDGTWECDA